jgi:hypothetical protein
MIDTTFFDKCVHPLFLIEYTKKILERQVFYEIIYKALQILPSQKYGIGGLEDDTANDPVGTFEGSGDCGVKEIREVSLRYDEEADTVTPKKPAVKTAGY